MYNNAKKKILKKTAETVNDDATHTAGAMGRVSDPDSVFNFSVSGSGCQISLDPDLVCSER